MIYYIISLLILIVIAFKIFGNSVPKDINKYKFLFRNDIFSSSKKEAQKDSKVYQLAPVMRGKAYKPYYIYFPEKEQYLVCSRLEPFGFRRYDAYAPPFKKEIISHVLLNNKGEIIQSFDAEFNFSHRSGMFFTQDFYINWLDSGDTTKLSYAGVYNKDVKMNKIQFADKFRELYAKSDYTEYVNLRTKYSDDIGKGVVFKIKKEWHILLDAVMDSHIYAGNFKENEKTGVDSYIYSLKFDYNDPDYKLTNPYPQSSSLIKSVYLETSNSRPYRFNSNATNDGLKLVKYQKLSSTGWQGIAAIKGIPIFVPGTGEGIAYMQYKIGNETIHFKIPDVIKYDYRSVYNLGVRTFKIPAELQITEPLVFIESMQGFGNYQRIGGGVYVVKPCKISEYISSLPKDISEERYSKLPLSLQVALLDLEGTTELKTEEWYPEIKLLSNLKYLKITGMIPILPDDISVLKKLEVLDLGSCRINDISDKIAELKELKVLNLFSNNLNGFPLQICKLKELTHLNIGFNNIGEIPSCISNLSKLRELNLLSLDSISLPETMVNMKELRIRRTENLKETLPENFHFLFKE
ncbi:hypothetical protein PG913_07305 [Tenacibaculum pacificus]|uniref:leucine-rich repeat domain-containing protein n=1 Tax=Tenacibaculum pacificus TaxID=3018314 RepID=UPI0022F3D23F|nr:hypothetical protein [Tenacibaculum pacificus]WBX72718.1 hypothetical protein PG913_07305 [Tenacibaculum pacificus]